MRCSLFGKLSAKRDFIALSVPREFLDAWEPWMQSCLSASRDSLKEGWLNAYLTSPIWRFWLGPDICGTSVLGATMPSLDGVGRYYPLTLLAYADPGEFIAPPEIDEHGEWFSSSEELLLSTLNTELPFDAISARVDNLPPPETQAPLTSPGIVSLREGVLAAPSQSQSFAELFTGLRIANCREIYASASFWWTIGGGDFAPFGFCCKKMPDPFAYTAMLTGRFNENPVSHDTSDECGDAVLD